MMKNTNEGNDLLTDPNFKPHMSPKSPKVDKTMNLSNWNTLKIYGKVNVKTKGM